ncbi:MAG: DNA cytosine methyltransferase [Pedobacter sp.]
MGKLTVIDFFCGAGGFSEGFRQQGFEIVNGFDHWRPAIETYDHNFGRGKGILQDILAYQDCIELIELLPDTDVILGSPPCVSFSSSNNSGKADKSLGVKLTETFLKIVVVKKFKENSILKAWFMENVTNSTNYLAREYNFKDLGLQDWAKKNRLSPSKIAIKIEGNSIIINSANYGSAQTRKRVISGEVISKGKLIVPATTHGHPDTLYDHVLPFKELKLLKNSLPSPIDHTADRVIRDPMYPELTIQSAELTDHFYDSGLYECQWKSSKYLKVNHPYMGTMSFPENDNRPSRTITATKIGTSRESLIYRSEYNRVGDGQYRTPTVREAATIMGFPLTHQFAGSEGTKWRLVGNAVCPSVSRAFASVVLVDQGLPLLKELMLDTSVSKSGLHNLNTFQEKIFNDPPKRKKGSRFRRHPFKEGNLTVTLSNYDIVKNEKAISDWVTSVQYGNGEGFPSFNYPNKFYRKLEVSLKNVEHGEDFIHFINNGFSQRIAPKTLMQSMYEQQKSHPGYLEPTALVEHIGEIIDQYQFQEAYFEQSTDRFFNKDVVPKKQLFALYALNKVATLLNGKQKK